MNHIYCPLQIKGSGSDGTFTGYGAVFGNTDSYGDVIAKGAFTDTLATRFKSGDWPALLLQHGGRSQTADEMTPIGVWTGLSEDNHGLKVEGKVALNTSRGADIYALMTMEPRPAINGLSIGYRATKSTMGKGKNEPYRTLNAVDLVECSIVTNPANTLARINSVKGTAMTEREFDEHMRDAGFSRSEILVIQNHGFKALKSKRDAALDEDDTAEQLRRFFAAMNSK